MARMEGVGPARRSLITELLLWGIRRRLGRLSETWPIVAHRPGILRWWGAFEMALQRSRLVDEKLKTLAQLKVSALVGCEACLDFHAADGRRHGVSDQQLRSLATYEQSDAFSELEKAVLDYAVAMTRTPANVPVEVFRRVRESFDEGQMVELTIAIAQENFRARFNRPFGIRAAGFSEGAYCPVPEA